MLAVNRNMLGLNGKAEYVIIFYIYSIDIENRITLFFPLLWKSKKKWVPV